jgi:hypothetical protein
MITPAFIDPPGAFASLEEWLRYRADLDALGDVPGIETFKRARRMPRSRGLSRSDADSLDEAKAEIEEIWQRWLDAAGLRES